MGIGLLLPMPFLRLLLEEGFTQGASAAAAGGGAGIAVKAGVAAVLAAGTVTTGAVLNHELRNAPDARAKATKTVGTEGSGQSTDVAQAVGSDSAGRAAGGDDSGGHHGRGGGSDDRSGHSGGDRSGSGQSGSGHSGTGSGGSEGSGSGGSGHSGPAVVAAPTIPPARAARAHRDRASSGERLGRLRLGSGLERVGIGSFRLRLRLRTAAPSSTAARPHRRGGQVRVIFVPRSS